MRIPEIEEAAKLAKDFNDGVKDFANNGLKNHYRCEVCRFQIVSIDRESGVTPFTTICNNCGGYMVSSMYRNVPTHITVTHEWFRPDNFKGLNAATVAHIKNGGLILRKIKGDE